MMINKQTIYKPIINNEHGYIWLNFGDDRYMYSSIEERNYILNLYENWGDILNTSVTNGELTENLAKKLFHDILSCQYITEKYSNMIIPIIKNKEDLLITLKKDPNYLKYTGNRIGDITDHKIKNWLNYVPTINLSTDNSENIKSAIEKIGDSNLYSPIMVFLRALNGEPISAIQKDIPDEYCTALRLYYIQAEKLWPQIIKYATERGHLNDLSARDRDHYSTGWTSTYIAKKLTECCLDTIRDFPELQLLDPIKKVHKTKRVAVEYYLLEDVLNGESIDSLTTKYKIGKDTATRYISGFVRYYDSDLRVDSIDSLMNYLKENSKIIKPYFKEFANARSLINVNSVNGFYTGKVINVTGTVVQQDVGRGKMIFHEASKLDQQPIIGQSYEIRYNHGIATVNRNEKENKKNHTL